MKHGEMLRVAYPMQLERMEVLVVVECVGRGQILIYLHFLRLQKDAFRCMIPHISQFYYDINEVRNHLSRRNRR